MRENGSVAWPWARTTIAQSAVAAATTRGISLRALDRGGGRTVGAPTLRRGSPA
ncbi:hypothetical protein AB0N17_26995 [Streptomyces sp. NPDC051133]|uniref:hypothetical protein n=1 Tax=Streptomyces sp. NPDC051133 TaxID=3155521 RepID=UPI00341EEB82